MTPKQRSGGGRDRDTRRLLLVMAAVMASLAVGVLALVARILQDGYLDARPKHATGEPILLYAAEEPFWFYGFVTLLVLLALMLLSIAWRMWRSPRG
jgi:H+/Cl- antiporter ClcA